MKIKHLIEEIRNQPSGTFIDLLPFNDHHFGALDIVGVSPVWEMHPDTDEFFYVAEGEAEFVLLEDRGAVTYKISEGSVFSIPRGVWHKPGSPNGMKIMYFTPGKSIHSDAEDPRI
ncbi:MAG: cupin domain-containing protein [Acidiferrobacterales bacterium]|nr:cupin domain-containing protein [Acidiferrobacterales bacterium]